MGNQVIYEKSQVSFDRYKFSSLFYNVIPSKVIGEKVLDVGAMDGYSQINSIHKEKFKGNGYLGIEINPPKKLFLNIINQDIFSFKTDEKFDTIILVQVIEHITFRDWFLLFPLLKKLLKDGGYIILNCPFEQKNEFYFKHKIPIEHLQIHTTFNINKKILDYFLPNAEFSFIADPEIRYREGRSKIFNFIRYLVNISIRRKRFVKAHIMAIWKKKE